MLIGLLIGYPRATGRRYEDDHGELLAGRQLLQLMFQADVSASTILRVARVPALLFLAGAGVLAHLWATRLYGPRGGLIALANIGGSILIWRVSP